MLKTLFKKQLMETMQWLLNDKKSGKKRSGGRIAGMCVLYLVVFSSLGMTFFFMADSMCGPMMSVGAGWLFYSIMGLTSMLLGIFGCVFTTYSSLYKAKDNDMLLSMPIKPYAILCARLFGTWFWSIFYEAVVIIPAIVVYCMNTDRPAALCAVCGIIMMLLISVFVLALSCILGWVVAKISSKLKNRSIVTVIIALAFIAAYYYVYSQASAILQGILSNIDGISKAVKGPGYPLYVMGRGGEGYVTDLLIFAAMVIGIFAVVCFVMTKTFINMAMASKVTSGRRSGKINSRVRSVGSALFFRELKRFVSSANYMLNCGLGIVLLPALGIFSIIKMDSLRSAAGMFPEHQGLIYTIACAMLCMVTCMNDISVPSISLEGRSVWMVQSFPVDPWKVIAAKIKLHYILTEIPALICQICFIIVLRPGLLYGAALIIVPGIFVMLSAVSGVAINLKKPNLNWSDETVPIKQSAGVFIAMFGGWGFIAVLAALYYAVHSFVPAAVYLALCTALIAALTIMLIIWLKKRGTRIFSYL